MKDLSVERLQIFKACEEGIQFVQDMDLSGYNLDDLIIEGDYEVWYEWILDRQNAVIEYNNQGLVSRITRNNGYWTSYTYSKQGRCVCEEDQYGDKVIYTYDEQNRLLAQEYSRSSRITYEYKDRGNCLSCTDFDGSIWTSSWTKVYDGQNRLLTQEHTNGTKIAYKYIDQGNWVKETFNNSSHTLVTEFIKGTDTDDFLAKIVQDNKDVMIISKK